MLSGVTSESCDLFNLIFWYGIDSEAYDANI